LTNSATYLGSVLSQNAEINDDITRRIGAASAAFGRLETRLWKKRGVRLSTKVAVYKAVVTTTLLYGCESWITYRADRKVLKVNPSPQSSPQIQDALPVMTAVDNSLQESALSVTRGPTGSRE